MVVELSMTRNSPFLGICCNPLVHKAPLLVALVCMLVVEGLCDGGEGLCCNVATSAARCECELQEIGSIIDAMLCA